MSAPARILPKLGAPVRLSVLGLIRLYRVTFGLFIGGHCRFHPSCSAYAEQAVRELGVARGVPLAVWRILRCGPWTAGGVDYPPSPAKLERDGAPKYDDVIQGVAGTPAGKAVEA